ncbi:MAG: mycofactocin precursor MftA [Actinomycetes bacterium]
MDSAAPASDVDEISVETLIEDVSIDGMCGVY